MQYRKMVIEGKRGVTLTNDQILRLEKVIEIIQGVGDECDECSVDRIVLGSIIVDIDDFIDKKKAQNERFGI